MGRLRNCKNCGWADWSIRKAPCKKCQEVGAFHKWKERTIFTDPDKIPDHRPDIVKYQKKLPFEGEPCTNTDL